METAIRHRMRRLVTIVLNNRVFGYQKGAEKVALGAYTEALHMAPVDHCGLARACGWQAIRISAPAEIEPALKTAFETDTPTLLEVMTDPTAFPPLVTFDNKLPDDPA